jgi:predicted RNA-binding Zn-ribbon protein involved in translation (DUF1610 family)
MIQKNSVTDQDKDRERDDKEHVTCPACGAPVPIGRMNVCYIGRYDCPNCGVSILIEGDKIVAEPPDPS